MLGTRVLCSLALLAPLVFHPGSADDSSSFARTSGTHFVLNGGPFFSNGFNAYWLMLKASDPAQKDKVSSTFQQASSFGMSVIRTWAFSDAGESALQHSPGSYNEEMFQVNIIPVHDHIYSKLISYFS